MQFYEETSSPFDAFEAPLTSTEGDRFVKPARNISAPFQSERGNDQFANSNKELAQAEYIDYSNHVFETLEDETQVCFDKVKSKSIAQF